MRASFMRLFYSGQLRKVNAYPADPPEDLGSLSAFARFSSSRFATHARRAASWAAQSSSCASGVPAESSHAR